MQIGITLGLSGFAGERLWSDQTEQPPRWDNIQRQALAAEEAGFDNCAVEDVIVDGGMGTYGFWDSVATLAAVAMTTSRIGLAHSMMNPPVRSPATIANAAVTLDEISGGRYTLGIGAGNSPGDYASFGYPTDHRYSRAAETVEIVHALLKDGTVDFSGEFYRAEGELTPKGPRQDGPPIVIGALGPRMIRLAVRFADGWNTWSPGSQNVEGFRPFVEEVNTACDELGRDPATLTRSLDVAVDTRPLMGLEPDELTPIFVHGDSEQIASQLLAFRDELGIDEVRCLLFPYPETKTRPDVITALGDVVELVHKG